MSPQPTKNEDVRSWHLKKEVPIGLIGALLMQSATIIWWARGQEARDADMDRRVSVLEKAKETDHVSERLAVLETKIAQVLVITESISSRLKAREDAELIRLGRNSR